MKNIEEEIIEYFKKNYDLNEYKDMNEACIILAFLEYSTKINYDTSIKKFENFLKEFSNLKINLKINKDILKFFDEIKKVKLFGRGTENVKNEYIEKIEMGFSKLVTEENKEMERLFPLFVNYYICNTTTDKNTITDENEKDISVQDDIIVYIGSSNTFPTFKNKTRNIENLIKKLKFKGEFKEIFSAKKVQRIYQYFINFCKILSMNDSICGNFSMSLIAFNNTAFNFFHILIDEKFFFEILKDYIYKSYMLDNDKSYYEFWNDVNKCYELFEENKDDNRIKEIINEAVDYDPFKKVIKPIILYYLDNKNEDGLNIFNEKYKSIIKSMQQKNRPQKNRPQKNRPQKNRYTKLTYFKNTFIPLHYCILFDNAYDKYNMEEVYKECEKCEENKIQNDCKYLKNLKGFKEEIKKIYEAYGKLCNNLDEYLFVNGYPNKIEISCGEYEEEYEEEYIDFNVINYFSTCYRKISNTFDNYLKDNGCYKDDKEVYFKKFDDIINSKDITDNEIVNYFGKCYGELCDNFEKYLKSRGYYIDIEVPFEEINDYDDLTDFDIVDYFNKNFE